MTRVFFIAVLGFAPLLFGDTIIFKDGRVCEGRKGFWPNEETILWNAAVKPTGRIENFYINPYQVASLKENGEKGRTLPQVNRADCEPMNLPSSSFTRGGMASVRLVSALDSKQLRAGDPVEGFVIDKLTDKSGAAVRMRVSKLSGDSGEGASQVTLQVESIEFNKRPVPLEETYFLISSDAALVTEVSRTGIVPVPGGGRGRGTAQTGAKKSAIPLPGRSAEREIDDILGGGNRVEPPVSLPAGTLITVLIGKTNAGEPRLLVGY